MKSLSDLIIGTTKKAGSLALNTVAKYCLGSVSESTRRKYIGAPERLRPDKGEAYQKFSAKIGSLASTAVGIDLLYNSSYGNDPALYLGVFFAGAINYALRHEEFEFSVPMVLPAMGALYIIDQFTPKDYFSKL